MIVLHVGPVDWTRASGMNASIPGAVASQALRPDTKAGLLVAGVDPAIPESIAFPVFEWANGRSLQNLSHGLDSPDLVVFHSTYIADFRAIARECRRKGIPYVITPRGGLTSGAQSSKRVKKQLANITAFRSYFHGAQGFHFLTFGESEESRRWDKPFFVVGNGVDLPHPSMLACPGSHEELRFTFIGRIASWIKGLDTLIEAIAMLQTTLRAKHAHVDIYGSVPGDDTSALKRMIAERSVEDLVGVHSRVAADARTRILMNSDVFLLPSRSEGHPMAALEALAHGVPCIVSKASRIGTDVVQSGSGWEFDGSDPQLAHTMVHALEHRNSLSQMGDRAHRFVADNYGWDAIAEKTLAGYAKILGRE